ncbi:hypothetical protein BH23GEM6_BH23GEM6_07140 [soil metagenome]
MQDVCDYLTDRIGEILVEWSALTVEQPWHELPEAHRQGSLPEVITGLIEASICDPDDRALHLKKVQAAAVHGSVRRSQAFEQELVLTEYYLMREAIWRVLKRNKNLAGRTDAIMLIDSAMNLATRASLAGFYREEYERAGSWPTVLEELVDQSPLLGNHARQRRTSSEERER